MTAAPESPFDALTKQVVPAVERAMRARFEAAAARAEGDARVMVEALGALAMRGGKRLRAALVCAGHATFGGDPEDVIEAAAAVEILHAYFLAHDDWMDQDEIRRGGPSVHAALRDRFGDERAGAIGAILCGDLGSALALEALASVPLAPARVLRAVRELAGVSLDVVIGQMIDVRNGASDAASVERMHELKTASYTVRGPLRVGAHLAGAEELAPLDAFATPLGVAFQLQDDVLGAFGDPAITGKPRGSDLREGKRTALVVRAMRDRSLAPLLDRVLGVADAPEDEVSALLEKMGKVKGEVERRVAELLSEARAALARLPRADLLSGAVDALAGRTR